MHVAEAPSAYARTWGTRRRLRAYALCHIRTCILRSPSGACLSASYLSGAGVRDLCE